MKNIDSPLPEGSNYIDESKIYYLREMVESPAYRSLSRVGLLMLTDFMCKRIMIPTGRRATKGRRNTGKQYVCENNGKIQFPYSEAVKKGYSREQFRNGLDELQRKGFIDIKHFGVGGRKPENGTGDSSLYSVDDRWRDFDEVTQRAITPPKRPRQKDTRMDRGFQRYWSNVYQLAVMLFQVDRAKRLKKEIKARKHEAKIGIQSVNRRFEPKQRRLEKKCSVGMPIHTG